MNTRNLLSTLSVLAVLALAQNALAAAPAIVPVQGHLTDANDQVLTGAHDMTFSLFEVATGGIAVHTETQQGLAVDKGLFIAYLGAQNSTPLDLALFRDKADLWLEVTIDGTEIVQPRFHVGSLPYAGFAQFCNDTPLVAGKPPADFAAASHTHAWPTVTNIPASWIDGDNDTLANKSCAPGQTLAIDANQVLQCTGLSEIASGTIMFFDLTACPSGWTELSVARGRAIVANGGTGLNAQVALPCWTKRRVPTPIASICPRARFRLRAPMSTAWICPMARRVRTAVTRMA